MMLHTGMWRIPMNAVQTHSVQVFALHTFVFIVRSCCWQHCLWICGRQPTWTHTYAIIVDYTLLLTGCGLVVVMTTLPPAVYQIVCQISCLCACNLAVAQADFQNVGVCACDRWSSGDWLSDPWSLQILKLMVSAPATHGVQGIDCQIPGLCVCHLCSLPDWWLDPWSLRCICHLAVYQVNFQNVGVRACHRWSSAGLLSDPWSACHPCNLREWWLDQVTSLFSAPATRAIDRIDFQTVGLCARPPCSLPS